MKSKRSIATATLPWLLLPGIIGLSQADQPKRAPSPAYAEVAAVANSTDLGPAEKVARLREFIGKEETRQTAFYHLDTLDPDAAIREALTLFRAVETPRQTRLWAGHFLLERDRPQREGFPKEFTAEYAKFLVGAILDGGEAEFQQKQDGTHLTAVGEYAFLSSGFDGLMGIDFAPFRDARVVPVLVRCLDAPDHLIPVDQGCVIRGTPGEPTGRNTARQQIPVALARLGDAQAIPALEKVLFTHADIYPRMNAAYALPLLLETKENRAAIGSKLLADPALVPCRLPFAKGMIEAGDDAGVPFLFLKHSTETPERLATPRTLPYHLDQRLNPLKGFRSPQVEPFIADLLAFQPWFDLVLFKPGIVRPEPIVGLNGAKDEAEALERLAPSIVTTYGAMLECVKTNHITSLAGQLQTIAKESHSEEIRRMTDECLKAIRE